MNCLDNNLWQCYQQTQFYFTQMLSVKLSFAIVTAHNPEGKILSSTQNRFLDKRLQKDIKALGLPYRSVVGASKDLLHMEKSWVIAVEKKVGVEIGMKFNQNAIYYVEADQLSLIPCLLPEQEMHLGTFSEKIKWVPELPELNE